MLLYGIGDIIIFHYIALGGEIRRGISEVEGVHDNDGVGEDGYIVTEENNVHGITNGFVRPENAIGIIPMPSIDEMSSI